MKKKLFKKLGEDHKTCKVYKKPLSILIVEKVTANTFIKNCKCTTKKLLKVTF